MLTDFFLLLSSTAHRNRSIGSIVVDGHPGIAVGGEVRVLACEDDRKIYLKQIDNMIRKLKKCLNMFLCKIKKYHIYPPVDKKSVLT